MTEQTSRLAIVIDSTGAEKQADNLATALHKMTQAGESAAASGKKVTKATEEEKAALDKLKAAIDPVGAAIDTVGRRFTELKKYFDKGLIDKEEFSSLKKKLMDTTDELSGVAQAQRDAEKAGRAAQAQSEAQAQALQRMIDRVDPLTAALRNLDQQQQQLSVALSQGKINTTQFDAYSKSLQETRREVTGEAQAERDAAKAHDEQRAALQRLVAQLDPVTEAFRRLDAQQEQLNSAKANGMLSPAMYDNLSGKISQARAELERTSSQLGKAGMSAKQTAFAMRQVPMQFTDIFTSLAAGQPPLQVFLQQGGQLKDMFGGIGPAAKALGGYVAGLVTPFTLAAAAVGVLGVAYYQGSQEQDAFNRSLILTGNTVGKTSGQLMDMSRTIAQSTGATVGASAEVLNRVVSAGKIASGSLQTVTEAAVNMNKATGIAVDQLVGDFEKIAGSPTEAISKLNDQYHFLSLATYNQIRALEEQGNKEAAAKLATEEYASVINSRAEQVKASLGTLESAWNATGRAAKWAWDSMLDVGRASTLDEKIAKARENVASRGTRTFSKYGNRDANQELNLLLMQKQLQDDLAGAQAIGRNANEKGIKAQEYVNTLTKVTLTNAQKRTKEQEKLTRAIADGAKISAEEEARLRKNIDEKYKDPKVAKGKAYTEDAATKLLDKLNEQTAAMHSQLEASDKLSSVTQQRIKFEQQIADLKEKKQLTADQKSILARADEILQAYKVQEALGNQVKTLDDYRKMQLTVNNNDKAANNLLIERLKLLDKAKAAGATDTQDTRSQLLRTMPNKPPSSVTGVTGGLIPKDGSLSGTFGGMQQQMQQLQDAQKALDTWQQESLASYQAYYQSRSDLTAEYEQQIASVKLQYAQQAQAIETQKTTIITAATQSMMDSGLSILKDGFGEQSGIYKAAFAASKAYAIAQSIISIQQGIAMAAANPFPANLLAMASVAAQTASIVANISSVAGNGFMSGGYTGNMPASSIAGVVHGKEFVFDAAATKKIGVSNLEALRNGRPLDATLGRSGFGTGAQNVSNSSMKTVNNFTANIPPVTINGNPSDATIQLVQQATRAGAEQGYRRVVNDMASGRGEAHKALVGGYNTSRRTG